LVLVLVAAALVAPAAVEAKGPPPPPPAPVLQWDTGGFSFGGTDLLSIIGSPETNQFTLTNSGGASGRLSLSLSNPVYKLTADTCSRHRLSAGGSCTVTVQYAPTSFSMADYGELSASSAGKVPATALPVQLHGAAIHGAISSDCGEVGGTQEAGAAGHLWECVDTNATEATGGFVGAVMQTDCTRDGGGFIFVYTVNSVSYGCEST
jgi:hypothetical protein